jgi:hypothetical protein
MPKNTHLKLTKGAQSPSNVTNFEKLPASVYQKITKSQLFSAMWAFLRGDIGQLSEFMQQATYDGHVSGVIIQLKSEILKLHYNFEGNEEHINYLKEVFKKSEIDTLIKLIIDCMLNKAGAIQIEFENTLDMLIPKEFKSVPATNLIVKNGKLFGKQDKLHKKDFQLGNDIIPIIYDEKFFPIMLIVTKYYLRKEFGSERQMSFIDLFGEPFRTVTMDENTMSQVDENTGKTFFEIAQDILKGMGSAPWGVFPTGADFKIQESYRQTYDHKNFLDDCDVQISRAVLGNSQTMGSKGHQGKNNMDGFKDITSAVASYYFPFVLKVINRELIPKLINYKFGHQTNHVQIVQPKPINTTLLEQARQDGYALDKSEYEKHGLNLTKSINSVIKPVETKE